MNKYDEYFDFKIATMDDVDDIMIFIKENWKKDHILAVDKDFFLYQYSKKNSNIINVFLMTDKCKNIVGINGFVEYSDMSDNLYVSPALTKIKNNVTIPMSGLELLKRFIDYLNPKDYFSYGANPVTILPLFKKVFKNDVGIMDQYYLLNENKKTFEIPYIKDLQSIDYILNYDVKLREISTIDEISDFDFNKQYDMLAFKSKYYFVHRFFKHPIYKYKAYKISCLGNTKAVIFTRKIEYNNSCIIRIVDFIGDINIIGECGKEFQKIMCIENAEYIDFLNKYFPENILIKSGFKKLVQDDDNIIIPTYFEPFVRKNIKIHYQSSNKNIIIFKADGDQDRPNYSLQ